MYHAVPADLEAAITALRMMEGSPTHAYVTEPRAGSEHGGWGGPPWVALSRRASHTSTGRPGCPDFHEGTTMRLLLGLHLCVPSAG